MGPPVLSKYASTPSGPRPRAFGRGRLYPVIKAFIKAQRVANPSAFFRTPATPMTRALELSELTHGEPTEPAAADTRSVSPANARGLEESVVGRLARDGQAEVMVRGRWGPTLWSAAPAMIAWLCQPISP